MLKNSEEMKALQITNQRSGKTIEQIHNMLLKYDPEIHSKITIVVKSCSELDEANELLREAVEEIEKAGSWNYNRGDAENFLNKPSIKKLRGSDEYDKM